jgi:hypothetical protein
MLFTDFSIADIIIVVGLGINAYGTVKMFNMLDRRLKALEERGRG